MSKQSYPITGIPVPPGASTPVRMNICEFMLPGNATQVSLFIQALASMQSKSFQDQLSYFRIAGIHGLPSQPWDGAPPPANTRDDGINVYCTHNMVTFPTWHRSYALLFEQVLYNIMMSEIVAPISDPSLKAKWTIAANTWRLPYWDWALPQSDTRKFGVPAVFNQSTIQITKPDGTKSSVDNPLYRFVNTIEQKPAAMGDSSMEPYNINFQDNPEFNKCEGTSRCIDYKKYPKGWVMGKEQNHLVEDAMAKPGWYSEQEWTPTGSIAHNLYRLLSNGLYKSYEPFASTKWSETHEATEYLSLEYIHNNIHDWTGEGNVENKDIRGHMAHVPVAAFDPIFWLHHCPDKDDPSPNSPLPPFHRDVNSTTYNPNNTQHCRELGYDYAELVNTNPVALKLYLYQTYGKAATDELKSDLPVKGNMEGDHHDYVVNVVYNRMALNGAPFNIRIFFGLKDEEGNFIEPSMRLGSIYSFSSSAEACQNCKDQQASKVYSKAQVPITIPLARLAHDSSYQTFSSMEPDSVAALLEKWLWWDVLPKQTSINATDNIAIVKVTVEQGQATYDYSEEQHQEILPSFDVDSYSPLYRATTGKPKGAVESTS